MDKEIALKKLENTMGTEITVERIYLFGSRARGTHKSDSDYDIAVVSPDFESMSFAERQRLIRPLARKALGTVPIDVVCYTPKEFETGKEAYLPAIIEREGIPA